MTEFTIPDRKFVDGPKKMISWRIPENLIKEIEKVSKEKGWTLTDLVVTVLDQYVQSEQKSSRRK